MDAQCIFDSDDSGWILDRIAGIKKIITPEMITQALEMADNASQRKCKAPMCVMLFVVTMMGVFTECSIRQVFKLCRRNRPDESTPERSTLCEARKRLGTEAIRFLYYLVTQPLAAPDTPGCFYQNYRLVGIDGVRYTVPDTVANELAFGRPKGGASGDSQAAFPQVGKLSLVELGTRAELGLVVRPVNVGEAKLAQRLCQYLKPDMLLMMDAGFYGYPLVNRMVRAKAQLLCRVPSTPNLKPVKQLSDGSYLAHLQPSRGGKKHRLRNAMLVRVIQYKLDDPARAGHGETHRLVTTLLDEKKHPAEELICLYHERWEQELGFDEQKTHQDPVRASKPTHLRSKTPAGVVQELHALSLAHFSICRVKADAAGKAGIDPDRISFTGTFQLLRCRLPECDHSSPNAVSDWYDQLLQEVAEEQLPERRNRINPRVVRSPRSKWRTKKPEDYGAPKPKPFKEAIDMAN